MITIVDQRISDDQQNVLITLSDGTYLAIQIDWATKFVQEPYTDDAGNLAYRDTDKSLLSYEIEQATVRAQHRADETASSLSAAQDIISQIGMES